MTPTYAILKTAAVKQITSLTTANQTAWTESCRAMDDFESTLAAACDTTAVSDAIKVLDRKVSLHFYVYHHCGFPAPPDKLENYAVLKLSLTSKTLDIRDFSRHYRMKPTKALRDLLKHWKKTHEEYVVLESQLTKLRAVDLEAQAVLIDSKFSDPETHASLEKLVSEALASTIV